MYKYDITCGGFPIVRITYANDPVAAYGCFADSTTVRHITYLSYYLQLDVIELISNGTKKEEGVRKYTCEEFV